MKGVVMDNAAFRFSRTFELFVGDLLKRIFERRNEEELGVTQEEAYRLVQAVIAESRASVSEEIESKIATKQFVEAEMAKVSAQVATKDFVRAEIAEVKNELVTKADLAEALKPYATKAELLEVKTELKQDIADVKSELKQDIAEVRTELHKTKAEIIKWVFGIQMASLALIGAMLKFML